MRKKNTDHEFLILDFPEGFGYAGGERREKKEPSRDIKIEENGERKPLFKRKTL